VEQFQQLAQFEGAYTANTDLVSRIETIYKITDIGTADSIAVLGRLFHKEKDNELKSEILDSLFDIDGLDDRKAALLAAGVSADQPQEVRETAIDGLTDLEPKNSLPILQSLLSDQSEDIRDLAKDAIEQVQAAGALQK
jgi:HEAT repeat protein